MRTSCCIFGTGNARPWYGFEPSFKWKETSFVFQSPKVQSKCASYFMRSCSNLFCWLALRCLQYFYFLYATWPNSLFWVRISFSWSHSQACPFSRTIVWKTALWDWVSLCLSWLLEVGFLVSVLLVPTLILCVVRGTCAPMFLSQVAMRLGASFLGNSVRVDSVLGLLLPFSIFVEDFSMDCALDLSWVHTRSTASRHWRSERMSMGFNPFSWRLNWSCHICGHIWRTWLVRSASRKAIFMGVVPALVLGL